MDWDPDFARRSPMFEPLRAFAAGLRTAQWPALDDLNRLLTQRSDPITTAGGATLKVVAQVRRPTSWAERYEARVFLRGELQMREGNWHDLLNLLTWLAFPRAKAALNARHYAALLQQIAAGRTNRGPAQDALTLFDEGGVIVASADDALIRYLRGWRWKELFWDRRALLPSKMRFYLFGHALYEKALLPFTGITGRGILWKAGSEFLAVPLGEQLPALDAGIAQHISDTSRLTTTRELEVVPVLGVPGWCADNDCAAYYDNPHYFRPARTRQRSFEE
jgi:Protein of unknown function (DUF3025)